MKIPMIVPGSWLKWIVGGAIVITVGYFLVAYGVPILIDRILEGRLKDRIAGFEKDAAERQERINTLTNELKVSQQTVATTKRQLVVAKQEEKKLQIERDGLRAKIADASAELARIREEVALVPASQLLARIRHALVALRAPLAAPASPSPTTSPTR